VAAASRGSCSLFGNSTPVKTDERSSFGRCLWPRLTKPSKSVLAAILVLLGGLLIVYLSGDIGLFQRKGLLTSTAGVLVLEDCDSDFRTPPFEDAVRMFGSDGTPVRKVSDLNICQTVGGCRSLSVARDGRFFTVCENVGNKLSAYQLKTGERLWSLKGESVSARDFTSAVVSPDGLVYALASDGTIYGKQTLVIDEKGQIVRQASVGGTDLALDAERGVLWLVGKTIKKCDLELRVLLEVNTIRWCAVSTDLDRDGSVWVAERQHPDVSQSTNRIFKISAAGEVLKSVGLAFSPLCLRVDRSDGSVWVTGGGRKELAAGRLLGSIEKRTGRLPTGKSLRDFLTAPRVWSKTQKYDQSGVMLCELERGGFSLDIDQTDGSLWIGGSEKVYRYSRQGTALGQSSGGSSNQKYITVVPGSGQPKEQHVPANSP
jgi:hypothetical protein